MVLGREIYFECVIVSGSRTVEFILTVIVSGSGIGKFYFEYVIVGSFGMGKFYFECVIVISSGRVRCQLLSLVTIIFIRYVIAIASYSFRFKVMTRPQGIMASSIK